MKTETTLESPPIPPLPPAKGSAGVLETIVDEIIKHDEDHPDHGVGCACHDRHAGAIRWMLNSRMLNVRGREKSLRNLLVVIGYVTRNP
jgi:hypothetical protein